MVLNNQELQSSLNRNPIIIVIFESDGNQCSNSDSLESELSTIQFRNPNPLSLAHCCSLSAPTLLHVSFFSIWLQFNFMLLLSFLKALCDKVLLKKLKALNYQKYERIIHLFYPLTFLLYNGLLLLFRLFKVSFQ